MNNIEHKEITRTWIDIRKEIGNKGEDIVHNYLKDIYKESNIERLSEEEAYKGYDISVDNIYYEAKVLAEYNVVYITRNELQKASLYKDKYILSVVDLRLNTLYLIKDPVKVLDLPVKLLINSMHTNEYCNVFIHNLKVHLKRIEDISELVDIREYI